ncbi:MAG: DUF6775 family putative metallopeptidase [Armatimonadota bacterium]
MPSWHPLPYFHRNMREIALFDDHAPECVSFPQLVDAVASFLPWARVLHRGGFPGSCLDGIPPGTREALLDAAATALAKARVRMPDRLQRAPDPLPAEIAVEKRRLTARGPQTGVPADGFRVQLAYRRLMRPASDQIAVIITGRLLLTYDHDDLRYHARCVIPGTPALISVPGLVEGPARPREYYLTLRSMGPTAASDELTRSLLAQQFRDRCLLHDDPRTTNVLVGYVLQALANELVGNPFCDDPNCRLFNAHFQEEMLHAQIESGRLCEDHRKLLSGGLTGEQ